MILIESNELGCLIDVGIKRTWVSWNYINTLIKESEAARPKEKKPDTGSDIQPEILRDYIRADAQEAAINNCLKRLNQLEALYNELREKNRRLDKVERHSRYLEQRLEVQTQVDSVLIKRIKALEQGHKLAIEKITNLHTRLTNQANRLRTATSEM